MHLHPIQTGSVDGGNTGKKAGQAEPEICSFNPDEGREIRRCTCSQRHLLEPDRHPQSVVAHLRSRQLDPVIAANQLLKSSESVAVGSRRVQQSNRNDRDQDHCSGDVRGQLAS
jgi:hypothetical protein